VSRVFFASPVSVANRLSTWASSGVLFSAASTTLVQAGVGLLIGGGAGIALALTRAWTPFVERIFEPYVMVLYAMPKIALAPAVILWFGRGSSSVPGIVFVSISVFAILFVSVSAGLRRVDPDQVRALQLMSASRRQIVGKLLLPHASRYVATGIAIAAPFALVAAIVIELLEGTGGLGGQAAQASAIFDATGVLAATVAATVLGLAINAAATLLLRRAPGASAI
jgi:NitT/TauT family transport system permease protein